MFACILMYKYLISLLIWLFILSEHLLSTHKCFMLCVKLVFVLTLVWAPCILVVHYEIIVDQYIVVSFGYIYSALPMVSRSVLAKQARISQGANIQHHIKFNLSYTCGIKGLCKTYIFTLSHWHQRQYLITLGGRIHK